jgi:hypothetical protein
MSVIIHAIFDRSEENEDGCNSKISEHRERKPGRYQDSPSGGG